VEELARTMPNLRKRILQNLLVAAVALIGTVLLAEGVLHVWPGLLPEESQLRLHWNELTSAPTVSEADPYLGFQYPASYRGGIDRGDTHFTYNTDERGYRNPIPWPDTAEVVVLGDSQAFGYGVEDDDAWVRLLSGHLSPTRVLNLGLIGGAPQQYTRVLERIGLGVTPRVVLYCLFPGNDIRDASLFEAWEEAGSPGNYDVWRFFRGRAPNQESGLRRLVGRSYLTELVRTSRRNFGSRFQGRTVTLEDGSRLRLAPGVLRFAAGRTSPDHPDFQRVLAAIQEAKTLAEEAGSAFVVVLVPTKEEVYLSVLDEPFPDLTGAFAMELERLGIDHLDLTGPFKEGAAREEALFFEIDGHPNAAGNVLISEVVRARLLEGADPYGLHVPD
jgi:lysophospholipase L1-like esterase